MILLVPGIILAAGICLVLKNNFLMFFISLELFVLAINLNFIFNSLILQENNGFFIAIVLLSVAAVDTAIGLSLLLNITHLLVIYLFAHGCTEILNYKCII